MKVTFEIEMDPEKFFNLINESEFKKTETKTESDTDINGVIYNDCLHSSPPRKNSDGTWRKRKNTNDQIAQIIPPPPIVTKESIAIPAPPAPPQIQSKSEISDFAKMMLYITPLLETNGKVNGLKNSDIAHFCKDLGCTLNGIGQLGELQNNLHLIPQFLEKVNAFLESNKGSETW